MMCQMLGIYSKQAIPIIRGISVNMNNMLGCAILTS
jgi:hypothetical protein